MDKKLIDQFREEYVRPLRRALDAIPVGERVGNSAYKKRGQQLEFLTRFIDQVEAMHDNHITFLAVAERICLNIDKYKLLESDLLIPQLECVNKIKVFMEEVRIKENFKYEYEQHKTGPMGSEQELPSLEH